MQKADPLIHPKLRPPLTRPKLVPRLRLQEQMAQGLSGPLTLITASAGFGKTTLVASCLASCGMPVGWLSLDKDDNQVDRFLNYLIAALQMTDEAIGIEAAQLLAAARRVTPQAVLISLINDLDAAGEELALVLDDYQFISRQEVHEAVAFLLEHCPNTFHLVIATRSDPPLPLARLRARGQTVELRAADLSFTGPEADQFLNNVMGLRLDAESVAALEERTEGWIAGLQMAALSMRDRKDIRGFIEGFSGTNRYILDYLLEEVLASQPSEIQRFLLCTSILERLTAPLCDALIEIRESRVESRNENLSSTLGSRAILAYLERANLFLIPLDEERIWYRYHHLFADLLHARLQQTHRTQDIAELHARAGQWYEQNGLPFEAIHHASLSANTEWVERLIEHNYLEVFRRREVANIRFLTDKLSQEMVYRRPWLCIYRAESQAWFGELDEADVLLAEAEKHVGSGEPSSDTPAMLGHIAYVKSRVTAMRGDVHRAIEFCLTAREKTPASNQALQGGIGVMLGYGYFLAGDFTNAIQTLNETIQAGISARVTTSTVAAYCVLARLSAIRGQLPRAYEIYLEAGRFAREVGSQLLGIMAIVDVGIADVLYEWNDLESAATHVKRGLENIPFWNKADDIALAYTTQARIQQAQGNMAAAAESIERGGQLVRTSGVFPEARNAVVTTEVRLWLAQGNSLAVGRWSDAVDKDISSGDLFGYKNELVHIMQARVTLAQKKLDEAIELLNHLEIDAQSGGRTGRLIEILILKASVMQKLGKQAQAIAVLEKSLALARPERYVRVFLNEGGPMQMLLSQCLAQTSISPMREYIIQLLSQFDTEPKPVPPVPEKAPSAGNLVEPLSQREIEVLHLMALGRTNQEIARQLVVAAGTIKAHAASIYRKLDVTNRTEAVARARQLSILP